MMSKSSPWTWESLTASETLVQADLPQHREIEAMLPDGVVEHVAELVAMDGEAVIKRQQCGNGENTECLEAVTTKEATNSVPLSSLLDHARDSRKAAQHMGNSDLAKQKGSVAMPPSGALMAGQTGTPTRRSKRRQDSVDEDSVETAARLAAIKNLQYKEGNNDFTNSFLSL